LMSKDILLFHVTVINKQKSIQWEEKKRVNSRAINLVYLKNVNILDIEQMDND
jgi:hypothetical protein